MSTASPVTLPISETFYSIQGEGKLTGVPSLFIRTSGCNLRCTWCDTPYASWNPESSVRSVDELVDEAVARDAKYVVLTGGEPMMFPTIDHLAAAFAAKGIHITIETAGTLFRELHCDLMSISPKLSNSTPREGDPRDPKGSWRILHEQRRLNIGNLQRLLDRYRNHQLKFVVADMTDLAEIDVLLGNLNNWNPGDVLLMPEGLDLAGAAPLLCAGITTYSPLKHWNIQAGMSVGVIGLGGLGHMGIKFAHAMGAKTTMITSSAHKAQDALRLGADGVLLSSDAAAMQAHANQFDFLLNTIPVYHDYNVYLPLLKVDGTMCIVGTSGMNAELNARSLIMGRRNIAGSLVGGIKETQEMLDFCAQHQILSDIEMIPMDGINQAYERMQQSDVKYRFVIDMSTLA
jgi:organic radical activating enzyme